MPLPQQDPASRHSPIRRRITLELLRDALSEPGAMVEVSISGGCMSPLLRHGDRLTVGHADPSSWEVGDMLLALEAGPRNASVEGLPMGNPPRAEKDGLVCHRLIARQDDGLFLGGDATSRLDHHLPHDVLGRVVAVRRGRKSLELEAGGWRKFGAFMAHLRWSAHLARQSEERLADREPRPPRWRFSMWGIDRQARAQELMGALALRIASWAWLGAGPVSGREPAEESSGNPTSLSA